MAAITAALVKELRESSGAGMMDCKKALTESNGDLTAAADWLRTKGLAAAAKKSGRVAAEGLVGVAIDGAKGAVVEVNSETDFVALNEQFQGFVSTVAKLALDSNGDIDTLNGMDFPGSGHTVADELIQMISTIGENMNLRRVHVLTVEGGEVAAYVHGAVADGLGKIGVLVAVKGDGAVDFGKQVAMHVAATNPASLSRNDLDPEIVEREKHFLTEQARESGKPEEIIEKMIVGRINKFYGEVCLLEQVFVIDGENKVGKAASNAGVEVTEFVRLGLGEGIEKVEEDFAAEVAAVAGA